jgi:hypothetical protein
LVDRVCKLSQFDLAALTKDLGAAVAEYMPLNESREEFARRLARYFATERRLDLLAEQVSRFESVGADRRLRVFISATWDGRAAAIEAADKCAALGIDTWLADRQIKAGDNVEEAIASAIQLADVFVLIASPGIGASAWMSREIGLALEWAATTGRPRIVQLVSHGCDLPVSLRGFPSIELGVGNLVGADTMDSLLRAFREDKTSSA